MRHPSLVLSYFTAFLTLFLAGCRSAQVAYDGMNFRQAMIQMYTDQVMDNLIRARTYQPFVQLSYRDLLVQDTDTVFGEISNSQAATDDKVFNIAQPLTAAFTRTILNSFGIRGTAERQGQMSFHAEPITDQNDIYEKYMSFAHNPYLLIVSDSKPKCEVHIMHKDHGKYYYIPCEAAPLFQDLVMKTTFMRGPETIQPGYYQARIVAIPKTNPVGRPGLINATIQFDKEVPNGTATMTVTLSTGRTAQLDLFPQQKPDEDHDVALGSLTNQLDAQWNTANPLTNFNPNDLIGATARIFSHDYPPTITQSPAVVQQIRDDLDRIRATQTNTIPIHPR